MKKIVSLLCLILLTSCSADLPNNTNGSDLIQQSGTNKVLLLKVDYTTNTFEGGKEFTFDTNTPTFSTNYQYVPPGDFGSIKIFYTELNSLLFYGDIIWMGTGDIHFPTNFQPASSFEYALTADDYSEPIYENIFDPNVYPANMPLPPYDYSVVWTQIQSLIKVREYRNANPNATLKIFLYQPSVGFGDPATWKWVIILKN